MRVQVVTSAGTTKESTTVVPTLALKSRAATYSALLFCLGPVAQQLQITTSSELLFNTVICFPKSLDFPFL